MTSPFSPPTVSLMSNRIPLLLLAFGLLAGCDRTEVAGGKAATPDPGEKQATSMESGEVESKVIEIVSKLLRVDKEKITKDSSFAELGADDLDQVERVMEIEDVFDLTFTDDVASEILTVGDAVKRINDHSKK